MRDNGCYFFNDGDDGRVRKIREKLGKFDRTNIPKLMSRMGQCFTQSKVKILWNSKLGVVIENNIVIIYCFFIIPRL